MIWQWVSQLGRNEDKVGLEALTVRDGGWNTSVEMKVPISRLTFGPPPLHLDPLWVV